MLWFRVSRATLVVAAILIPVLALSGAGPAKKPAAAKTTGGSKVERGRYLVQICSCNDCHTPGTLFGAPDFERMLSGSEVGWSGPWGVSYARNLTPDKETGIGSWSDEDIIKAFRTGKRPDGTVLQPPMPWQNLNAMSDADAKAIVAFLRSIPAISHKVPDKLAPGQQPTTPVIPFPAPGAWDAPKGAPGAGK